PSGANGRKHFRWTKNGKQYRRKAGTCSDTQPGGWFSLAIAMQIKKSCGRMAVSWFLFLPPNKQACSILQNDIAVVRHEPRSTLTWRRLSADLYTKLLILYLLVV